jgi:predicted nucleic acid-binding protein
LRAKIYLDTSVVSALFDERTPERKSQTYDAWQLLSDYDVYLSETVVFELGNASDELKTKMLEAVKSFTVIPITAIANELADEYVSQGIFLKNIATMQCTLRLLQQMA